MRRIWKRLGSAISMAMLLMATIAIPAFADTGAFVCDTQDILSHDEFEQLEATGASYAKQYDMGVYLLITSSMGLDDDSPDVRNEFARDYFEQQALGVGEGRNGIVFVIAVDSRKYVTVKHMSSPEVDPFSDDCVDALEHDATDHLSDDEWFEGAQAYYDDVGEQLQYFAENGTQWQQPHFFELVLKVAATLGIPFAVAMMVVSSEKNAMLTARLQSEAAQYLEPNSFDLRVSTDAFQRRSITAVPIPKKSSSSGGGGWSSMGGGYSGSGGGDF